MIGQLEGIRVGEDPTELEEAAKRASDELEHATPEAILVWAAETIPRLVLTSSFGAESAPLLHILSRVAPQVPVLFLETGFHFSETIDYRRRLADELGLNVIDVRPELNPEEQAVRHGPALYERDPDWCCHMRKTEPLKRALAGYDGWVSGVRRSQTPQRADTPVVQAVPHGSRWIFKVSPLVRWTAEDVGTYQLVHELPEHPLLGDGYLSIGCEPCTSPVAPGDDPRAGRWAGSAKTECGIHLAT